MTAPEILRFLEAESTSPKDDRLREAVSPAILWANEDQSMPSELIYALQGLGLGFHAGISPGPMTTLLIGESLNHGRRAGWRLVAVPICTDLPLLCIMLPLLYGLTGGRGSIIGCIAIAGACLLTRFALNSFKVSRSDFEKGNVPRTSFGRALLINGTNPNVYICWLTISGTLAVSALRESVLALGLFVGLFYVGLVGTASLVVLAVGSARHSMNVLWLVRINRVIGLAMLLYAAWFFRLGIGYLFP